MIRASLKLVNKLFRCTVDFHNLTKSPINRRAWSIRHNTSAILSTNDTLSLLRNVDNSC